MRGECEFECSLLSKMQQTLGTFWWCRSTLAARRAGDVRDSLADIGAAKRVIGYEPAVYFDEGLASTVKAYAGR